MVVLLFVSLLAYHALGIKVGIPDASVLPQRLNSRVGIDILKREFSVASLYPTNMVVQTPEPILSRESIAQLYSFT